MCVFIRPEYDHWQCLSLTNSLPNSCLVNLSDVTLACEDASSKLVEVVTVAHVSDEDFTEVRFVNAVTAGSSENFCPAV